MLINLWSTPRTGSIWYSKYLAKQYENSIWLSEFFNTHDMNLYSYFDKFRQHKSTTEYSFGCWYRDYFIKDGIISYRLSYNPRRRAIHEEEVYRRSLIDQCNLKQNIILHNHVRPMDDNIRKHLVSIADKNIYITRNNKREQLYSFAIALSTKEWVKYTNGNQQEIQIDNVDLSQVNQLLDHIKFWDSIDKNNADIIAYEDINFVSIDGMPMKQNTNHISKLNISIVEEINRLVDEYEKYNVHASISS